MLHSSGHNVIVDSLIKTARSYNMELLYVFLFYYGIASHTKPCLGIKIVICCQKKIMLFF